MDTEYKNNIEIQVLLLGLYKKNQNETFTDIINTMHNTKVFTSKVGKQYLKYLKKLNYITEDSLTFIGVQKAQEVEKQFSLQ